MRNIKFYKNKFYKMCLVNEYLRNPGHSDKGCSKVFSYKHKSLFIILAPIKVNSFYETHFR